MNDTVLGARPLGFPWATADPFLSSVHHGDAYPAGDDYASPAASLSGSNRIERKDP